MKRKSQRGAGRKWLLGAIAIVGIFVVSTCLYIEYLNSLCGALPNQEWYNGDPANGPVKWRGSTMTDEPVWRMIHLQEFADYETRSLTESQRSAMNAGIKRAIANNALRGFVASWGLLQYLAIPLLVILSITGLRYAGRVRAISSLALCLALVTGWRLYALAYFSSLGW